MTSQPRARRSDTTRAAILDAARRHFAAHGYERTTIRAVARDAGIDASMVMRYYGNKESLFAAASEFHLELPDIGGVPREDLGALLVGHFVRRWDRDDTLVALLRASVTHAAVADRLRQVFLGQLLPVVAAVRSGRPAAERAAFTASQMLGLALCRYVLRIEPVADMAPGDVVTWLGPTVQRHLTGDGPAGSE